MGSDTFVVGSAIRPPCVHINVMWKYRCRRHCAKPCGVRVTAWISANLFRAELYIQCLYTFRNTIRIKIIPDPAVLLCYSRTGYAKRLGMKAETVRGLQCYFYQRKLIFSLVEETCMLVLLVTSPHSACRSLPPATNMKQKKT